MMAVLVQWDNADRTIVRQAFEGWWHVEDYQQSLEALFAYASKQPHRVHYILDFTAADGFLGNLPGVARQFAPFTPPNLGLGVLVSASYQTEMMFEIAARVAPRLYHSLRHAETLHAAREMIYSFQRDNLASA